MNDVIITGVGALTGQGPGFALDGACAPRVGGFNLRERLGDGAPRRLDRLSEMALFAAHDAWGAAGAERLGRVAPAGRGIAFASMYGNLSGTFAFLENLHAKGARFASPLEFPNLVLSAPAGHLSTWLGSKGELLTFSHGALAGLQAVIYAAMRIAAGHAEVMLAAGAEAYDEGRQRLHALGRADAGPLGEGAAAVVLEAARGQAGAARVAGFAMGSAPAQVIRQALARADLARVDLALTSAATPRLTAGEVCHEARSLADATGFFDAIGVLDVAYAAHLFAAGKIGSALIASAEAGMGACAVVLRPQTETGKR